MSDIAHPAGNAVQDNGYLLAGHMRFLLVGIRIGRAVPMLTHER